MKVSISHRKNSGEHAENVKMRMCIVSRECELRVPSVNCLLLHGKCFSFYSFRYIVLNVFMNYSMSDFEILMDKFCSHLGKWNACSWPWLLLKILLKILSLTCKAGSAIAVDDILFLIIIFLKKKMAFNVNHLLCKVFFSEKKKKKKNLNVNCCSLLTLKWWSCWIENQQMFRLLRIKSPQQMKICLPLEKIYMKCQKPGFL